MFGSEAADSAEGRTPGVSHTVGAVPNGCRRRLRRSPESRRREAMNVMTARKIEVAPGVSVATRNPVALWLLAFITLGIGAVVWTYAANRELRDFAHATGRPFHGSPALAAVLAGLWPFALIPALIPVWTTSSRARGAQQSDGLERGSRASRAGRPGLLRSLPPRVVRAARPQRHVAGRRADSEGSVGMTAIAPLAQGSLQGEEWQ